MNHVALHQQERKNKSILVKKKEGKKSLLYSPQALVSWAGVTALEPEQAWVPRLECRGAGEGGCHVLLRPCGPGVPAALCMSPLPPDPGGRACSEKRLTPSRGGVSGLEEL